MVYKGVASWLPVNGIKVGTAVSLKAVVTALATAWFFPKHSMIRISSLIRPSYITNIQTSLFF